MKTINEREMMENYENYKWKGEMGEFENYKRKREVGELWKLKMKGRNGRIINHLNEREKWKNYEN